MFSRTPVDKDCLEMSVKIGAITSASSFSMRHGTKSGPPAFDGSISFSSFATPFSLMFSPANGGRLGPSRTVMACRSSLVKTEENWSFRICALFYYWVQLAISPERGYPAVAFVLWFQAVIEHTSDVFPSRRSQCSNRCSLVRFGGFPVAGMVAQALLLPTHSLYGRRAPRDVSAYRWHLERNICINGFFYEVLEALVVVFD